LDKPVKFGIAYVVIIAVLMLVAFLLTGTISEGEVIASLPVALAVEGIGYGFYLAWRGVIGQFKGGGLGTKPSRTPPNLPTEMIPRFPSERKIVPNCKLFSHPHVHTFVATGHEKCEEEAAGIRSHKLRFVQADRLTLQTGLSPDAIGHYKVLVGLTFAAFISYGLFIASGLLGYTNWAAVPDVLVALASVETIWSDAKAINQAVGTKVIEAGWWSLFGLLVSFVGVPLYTFERRRNVLRQLKPTSSLTQQNKKFCGKCGAPLNEGDKFCYSCGAQVP
jgi:hypothetical protein